MEYQSIGVLCVLSVPSFLHILLVGMRYQTSQVIFQSTLPMKGATATYRQRNYKLTTYSV